MMTPKRLGRLVGISLLLAMSACIGTGYDQQRYTNDRNDHALAQRCAEGWFAGMAFTDADKRDVEAALAGWASRLDRDATALGIGAK